MTRKSRILSRSFSALSVPIFFNSGYDRFALQRGLELSSFRESGVEQLFNHLDTAFVQHCFQEMDIE